MMRIECGDECGTKHFNRPFDPMTSSSNENFKCNERFNNYMCFDCEQKCPFQIVLLTVNIHHLIFSRDIQKEAVIKGSLRKIMLSLEMKSKTITLIRAI